LPKTVEEAYEIDRETQTDYWHKVILKEMKNNAIAFKFIEDDAVPIGYQWIPCHMIFDIKLDLTRKARFVAGGHWTDPDPTLSYSTVVTRDSVRITFLIHLCVEVFCDNICTIFFNTMIRKLYLIYSGVKDGVVSRLSNWIAMSISLACYYSA